MTKFNRLLSLILCIIMVISCGYTVTAQSVAKPYAKISSVYDAVPGKKYSVTIEVGNLDALSSFPGGYDLRIQFPEELIINSVCDSEGEVLSGNGDYRLTEDNILIFMDSFNEFDIEDNGGIYKWTANITVSNLAEVGCYPIGFKKVDVVDGNIDSLAVEAIEGCVLLNVAEDTLFGDTDGDGAILATDVAVMRKFLIKLEELNFCAENADLNYDGNINLKDFVGLKKYLASLAVEFHETKLSDANNLKYLYEGNGYAYAITNDNQEIIAFKDDDGYIDILSGAGNFMLYSDGAEVLDYTDISYSEPVKTEKGTSLTVTYTTSGAAVTSSSVSTTYLFHNGGISVTSDVSCESNSNIDSAVYKRDFINTPIKTDKKLNYNWIFPENGDFPYQELDCMATVSMVDNTHSLYTFNRDENAPNYYYVKTYPTENLPVNLKAGKTVNYQMKYDLVFEKIAENYDMDASALFKGQQSSVSFKVAPAVKNDDNSTVFVGDSVKLNLKASNLTNSDASYDLKYTLYDYYGNTVDNKNVSGAVLASSATDTYEITASGNYGMYYLRIDAKSDDFTYTEYYPFMLIEDYEYGYLDSSKFGVNALHRNSISEENTNVSLCEKLGIGIVRVGNGDADLRLAKKLYNVGTKTFVNTNATLETETKVEELVSKYKEFDDYSEWFTLSNEVDYSLNGNYDACLARMEDFFIPNYFNNVMRTAVKNNNMEISWGASCHGNEEWAKVMYESGVWGESDVIDTHLYCYPKLPDKKYIHNVNEKHSVEYGLERMLRNFENYDKGDKTYIVGETGYPTNNIDLRTQADFNTRIGVLALAYGADYVNYYSMFNRTSYFTGADIWSEMNFGAFYCYDFYGITKPKPWAAAFSAMTRQLDGVETAEINTKYDLLTDENRKDPDEATVRAFNLTNKKGETMMVAWSNIYALPNTTSVGVSNNVPGIPTLPWQNQWAETEDVTFDAMGSTVTVTDTMGNTKTIPVVNGKATITLSGSPIYINGVY